MNKALHLQPASAFFWARLGYLKSYISSEELEYREAFDQVMRLAPYDARLLFDVGSYLVKIGDDEYGFTILERAFKINPSLRGGG